MNKIFLTSVKFTFAGLLIWLLIHTSLLSLERFTYFFLYPFSSALVISIFIFMVLINAWRWHRLNQVQEIPLPFSKTFTLTYIGIAFNNVLPGSIGGDFIRLYSTITETRCSKSRAALSIFTDRLTGLLGIFLIVCLVAISHFNVFYNNHTLFFLLLSCTLVCIIGALFLILSALLPNQIGLSNWLAKHHTKKWSSPLISVLDAIRAYRNKKIVILECLAFSALIQIFMVINIMLIADMLELPSIPFIDYAIAISLTQIINLIPLAPGGIGVGEIAFANVILTLHPAISAPYATVFLGYRLLGMVSYLPAIMIYTTRFKVLKFPKPLI